MKCARLFLEIWNWTWKGHSCESPQSAFGPERSLGSVSAHNFFPASSILLISISCKCFLCALCYPSFPRQEAKARGWRDNAEIMCAFPLHTADLSSVPGIQQGSLSPPGEIPEHIGVNPEYSWVWVKNKQKNKNKPTETTGTGVPGINLCWLHARPSSYLITSVAIRNPFHS